MPLFLFSFAFAFIFSSSSDLVYCIQVYVLKPSHKSTLQSTIIENSVPDSVSAIPNATNATRDAESEFEVGHEGKNWEVVLDSVGPAVCITAKDYIIYFWF